jgi:hypothetical protein
VLLFDENLKSRKSNQKIISSHQQISQSNCFVTKRMDNRLLFIVFQTNKQKRDKND